MAGFEGPLLLKEKTTPPRIRTNMKSIRMFTSKG